MTDARLLSALLSSVFPLLNPPKRGRVKGGSGSGIDHDEEIQAPT
jgi:hypothetical protein